jgi:hypothetical protein
MLERCIGEFKKLPRSDMNPVVLSGNRDRLIIIVVENVDAIKMKTLLVIVATYIIDVQFAIQ